MEKDSETGSGAKSGERSFKFNLNCLNCLNCLKCLKRLPGSRAAGTAKISKWFGFSNLFVVMDGNLIFRSVSRVEQLRHSDSSFGGVGCQL